MRTQINLQACSVWLIAITFVYLAVKDNDSETTIIVDDEVDSETDNKQYLPCKGDVNFAHCLYGGVRINLIFNVNNMASINQLVSEVAHSLKQPNNHVLRENLRVLILHTRNELIRQSYENHGYVDKGLTQRFRVSLIEVNDGDIDYPKEVTGVGKIKRSTTKVPTPVRLTNNLPFDRVSSVGWQYNREFPFIKETSARFRKHVPGLCGACYDYINGYLYIFPSNNQKFNLDNVIIEGAFEHPTEIMEANGEVDHWDVTFGDNEFLLSEDMIGKIKDIIYKRDLLSNVRETDEVPDGVKYNG